MSTAHTHQLSSWRDWREARRQRAWELHHKGWKQCLIAEALGVSQGAVSQWLKCGTLHGGQALCARPRPGRPALLMPDQRAQLGELLAQGAEAFGFRGAVWTRRRVAQLIKDQFGISYEPRHVGRILGQIGWSPQKPLLRATQRDEAAIAAWYTKRWPAIKKKHAGSGKLSCG
jgi:transposase